MTCEAIEFPGRMICPRCDQSWPGNMWSADRPYCKSEPSPHITVNDMIAAATYFSGIETDSQLSVVKAYNAEPHRPAMRRIAILKATARLLERVVSDQRIMRLLKEHKP